MSMTERREPADARTASPAATTHPQPRPTHGHQPLPLDNRLSIWATMQSPGRRQPGYSYATRPSENCRAWPFLCVRTTTATGSRRRLPTYVRSRAAIGRSTTVSSDPFVHRSHGQIIFRRPPTKRPVGSDRRALRMAREQACSWRSQGFLPCRLPSLRVRAGVRATPPAWLLTAGSGHTCRTQRQLLTPAPPQRAAASPGARMPEVMAARFRKSVLLSYVLRLA